MSVGIVPRKLVAGLITLYPTDSGSGSIADPTSGRTSELTLTHRIFEKSGCESFRSLQRASCNPEVWLLDSESYCQSYAYYHAKAGDPRRRGDVTLVVSQQAPFKAFALLSRCIKRSMRFG